MSCSLASRLTLSRVGLSNRLIYFFNVYSKYIIYKYGAGPHNTTWRAPCVPRAARCNSWYRTSHGSGCILNSTSSRFCNTFLRGLVSTVTHSVMILSKYFLYIVGSFLADDVFRDAAAFYVVAHVMAAAMLRNMIK